MGITVFAATVQTNFLIMYSMVWIDISGFELQNRLYGFIIQFLVFVLLLTAAWLYCGPEE